MHPNPLARLAKLQAHLQYQRCKIQAFNESSIQWNKLVGCSSLKFSPPAGVGYKSPKRQSP